MIAFAQQTFDWDLRRKSLQSSAGKVLGASAIGSEVIVMAATVTSSCADGHGLSSVKLCAGTIIVASGLAENSDGCCNIFSPLGKKLFFDRRDR